MKANREPYPALVAADYYGTRRARRVAIDLKVPTPAALRTASKGLAEVLFRRGVKNPILVPIPASSGSVAANTALARATAARLHARWRGRRGAARRAYVDRVVAPYIERLEPVTPGHLRRRAGQAPLTREDHVFEWGGRGPWAGNRFDVSRVYLVDNVLTSGATMLAAQGAVGGGTPLVWARSFDHDWKRAPRGKGNRRPATPREVQYASGWEYENPPRVPSATLDWTVTDNYPTAKMERLIPGGAQGWRDWWYDEVAGDNTEHWDSLEAAWQKPDPSHDPIVVIEDASGKVVGIWDGWHRTAISMDTGAPLPAVVGRMRKKGRASMDAFDFGFPTTPVELTPEDEVNRMFEEEWGGLAAIHALRPYLQRDVPGAPDAFRSISHVGRGLKAPWMIWAEDARTVAEAQALGRRVRAALRGGMSGRTLAAHELLLKPRPLYVGFMGKSPTLVLV